MYDSTLFSAGPNVADGAVIRTAIHMFEEADKWPAVEQFKENLDRTGARRQGGAPRSAGDLGVAAVRHGGQRLRQGERQRAGAELRARRRRPRSATGRVAGPRHDRPGQGGADAIPPTCTTLIEVKNGKFERLYPKIGGEDDDLDGFHCPSSADGTAKVTEDLGQGAVDPHRPI